MDKESIFREAMKENESMIFRICSHFFGPGDDAKDAYQEVLLKIWLNIEKFRGEAQLKTWIYRVAVNVCITFSYKSKRKTMIFVPLSRAVNYPDKNIGTGDEENKMLVFREFMNKLNSADKILVSLYLEEVDTKEIAQITGLTESNVRVKIHRIKNQIKNEWELKYGTG